MAFLREGAVKDLMMRAPELQDLLDWSAENVLYVDENPSPKIKAYANEHGMTVSELESFVNIQLTSLGTDQSDEALDTKDVLMDLLFNIEEGRTHGEINETKDKEKSFYPRLELNERYSLKKVVDVKLQPIADDLGADLIKGEKKVEKSPHGSVYTNQYYMIGDVKILLKDAKVPGMGADDVELWVLDQKDPTKGIRFSGMNGYSGLLDLISGQMGATGGTPAEPEPEPYTMSKLEALLLDLKSAGGDEGPVGDDEAFDLADGILADEPGLEKFLRMKLRIRDPLGWLANKID